MSQETANLQSKVRDIEAVIEQRTILNEKRKQRYKELEVSENKSALATVTAAKCEVEQTLKTTEVSWHKEKRERRLTN